MKRHEKMFSVKKHTQKLDKNHLNDVDDGKGIQMENKKKTASKLGNFKQKVMRKKPFNKKSFGIKFGGCVVV